MFWKQIAQALRRDTMALAAGGILVLFIAMALLGPGLAPYDPEEILRDESGAALVLEFPSLRHPFGTTDLARDIFSQILTGARPVLIVGFWAALLPTGLGLLLGVLAGYKSGASDTIVSRFVEIAYSLPFEPVAIVLISLISPSRWTLILAISLLYWRRPTRVIRNQVLTLRDTAFIKAARVAGASSRRIMFRHLIPLVLPLAFVYIPVAFGNAILAEASISFLGFGDPQSQSWGSILRKAFDGGALDLGWWWMIAPGLAITVVTSSMFFLTRPFEEVLNPRLARELPKEKA